LWTHALLFLNIQSPVISGAAGLLRLTSSEIVLFALLLSFSFLAASGFWKTIRSLAYIYLFPFVLFMYFLYFCFLLIRATHRWLKVQGNLQMGEAVVSDQKALTTLPGPPTSSGIPSEATENASGLLRFLLRPFRRFTFLWCILLVVATHAVIVWLSLVVVLIHLARKIRLILKMVLFSDLWLQRIGANILTSLDKVLAGLAGVTLDSTPTVELRTLWNQVSSYRRMLDFLRDPYILSRWAWVLGIAFLGSVYAYMAVLFSFGYYGIARVGGVRYSWPEALVNSVFIPFFATDLPKILAIRVLGGIQCTLVVLVGIGTIRNFLQRKLNAVCAASAELSNRLREREIQEKYLILEEKFSNPTGTAPGDGTTKG